MSKSKSNGKRERQEKAEQLRLEREKRTDGQQIARLDKMFGKNKDKHNTIIKKVCILLIINVIL
mgnify:CR=1 FL=1